MQITNIHIRRMAEGEKMKAVVSVTFDDAFVVHDIKIIQGAERTFVAMPSRKTPDGRFADIAHPIHMTFRHTLEQSVLQAYYQTIQASEA